VLTLEGLQKKVTLAAPSSLDLKAWLEGSEHIQYAGKEIDT